MSIKNIKTHEKIQVIPRRGITEEGKSKIASLLYFRNIGIGLDDCKKLIFSESSEITNKHGKFAKRIKNRIKKEYGIKLSNDIVSEIGNIVNLNSLSDNTENLTFDITDSFDWYAGDFGDYGSCYWECHTSARDTLEYYNALAIRSYDENGNGLGRAWIAQYSEDILILFNGYGNLSSNEFAMILSQMTGLPYKKISLANLGSSCGHLWINSGVGYAIGDIESIGDSIDLEYYEEFGYYSENRFYCYCESCGDGLHEDDVWYTDDSSYCESCYDDLHDSCESCGEYFLSDDMLSLDDCLYCESCYDECAITCEECADIIRYEDSFSIDDSYYCKSCYDDLNTCEDCNKTLVPRTEIITQDGHTICEDCLDDNFTCPHCNNTLFERTYCTCLQIPLPI